LYGKSGGLIGMGMLCPGGCLPEVDALKKNGSIEALTVAVLATFRSCEVAGSKFLWNVTPCGKLALFGVLFAEKMP
jgi:hypothetical protein